MKLLVAAFLLFTPLAAQAKTAATLISDTRLLARDPSATGRVRFSDAQILSFLNEAQDDAVAMTLCLRKQYSFVTSSGTRYYEMPADFISVDRLIHDNDKFEEKSPAKLDLASIQWEIETGIPINFFINFSSRTMVGFYPYPVTNTSTATVIVEYFAQATTLVSASIPYNAIEELYPFHSMLSYFAAARMLEIDGLMGLADRYTQKYYLLRSNFGEYCRARPTYYPNINVAPGK
jgi:hypothetical protein